ncbi:DoxX family protein [Fulvivirga lutea]|uniref:DoxX family protein n=1 Tax=Fulvivirga lutea TaxID=2810512 RepID=A0A974WI90_9BACT|nr:DoxX family protein [Fulvivirga lutea]QSE97717.1 DoxX family protein [Fulvivirga lutea]
MKKNKIIFMIATGFLSVLMLMSAGMYFFNYDEVSGIFDQLGYPTYIIYPLGVLKVLGLVAIWTRLSTTLVYFAYAGFLYDFMLAFSAHVAIGDGQQGGAVVAIVLWLISFTFYKKVYA